MDVDYGCSHNLLQMMLVDTLRMGKTTRSALYLLWVVGMATRLAAGAFSPSWVQTIFILSVCVICWVPFCLACVLVFPFLKRWSIYLSGFKNNFSFGAALYAL